MLVWVLQMNAPSNMATLGTSEHSRKRQIQTIRNVLMYRIFIDLENDKIRKKALDFILKSIKIVWKKIPA